MSVAVSVKGDIRAVRRHMDDTRRKVIPRAQQMALNRTMPKVRTQTVRDTATETGVKQTLIRQQVHFKGRLRARRGSLESVMLINARGIPVHRLGRARQTRAGVSVGRNRYPGAFMPAGRNVVWRRKGAARLPVERVEISISEAANRAAGSALRRVGVREYPIELERALNNELRKIKQT